MPARFLIPLAFLSLLAPQAGGQPEHRPIVWNHPDLPRVAGAEHGTYRSPSLGVEVGYSVWLPPGYSEAAARYPAVYFLHGLGGDENSDLRRFARLARKGMDEGRLPACICVFPNGGAGGYEDRPATNDFGETMLIKELLPRIDTRYRTAADRDHRALAGFSMGGGGAFRLALKYPDLFCAAVSWGGGLRWYWGSDPVALARRNRDALRSGSRFLLVVGDRDELIGGHPERVKELQSLGIECSYRVLADVGHDLDLYYERTGDEAMSFIGKSLKPLTRSTP